MSLTVFTSDEFGDLRAVATNDTPEVIASDVARILGYPEANKLTRLLDDDEKGHHKVATLGGMQTMTTLNEAGFYRAVMLRRASCIKDLAARERVKRFQRWVTHDVLPAIRRDGGYIAAEVNEPPEVILARALKIADETMRRQSR
jgi:anti-repressor protein